MTNWRKIPGLVKLPITRASGVYFLCAEGSVRYVGKSIHVLQRIGTHTGIANYDEIYFLPVPVEKLVEVEGSFIRRLKPPLNKTTRTVRGNVYCLSKRFV